MLDIQSLETWLWDAACAIRGPVDAPKFKDYILPLVFLKRLFDVFDDEIEYLSTEYSSRDLVLHLLEQERQSGQVLKVRFDIRVEEPSLEGLQRREVWEYPLEALREENGQYFVYLKSGLRFEKRFVQVGLKDDIQAAVLSGLKSGDEVALTVPPAGA